MGLRVPLKRTRRFHDRARLVSSRREQGFTGLKDHRT